MKPIYHQYDCKEDHSLDLRQAKAVLKHKPDIIILEYPNNSKTPSLLLNKYSALEKPRHLVEKRLKDFPKDVLKIHPWVKADTIMWKNINTLWQENHQVLVYAVDAPSNLTGEWLEIWNHVYPCAKKNWVWWVKIYLREKIMAKNFQWILDNYSVKKNPEILIFLQNFHWKHVQFLMKKPTKNEIWNYYFGNFSEINRQTIGRKIKDLNEIFYKYWKNISDF